MLRFAAIIPAIMFSTVAFAAPLHGISMHGDPALLPSFTHLPYTNPNAKKGGSVTYGVVGTYDNLNPFILKGLRTTARGMWDVEFGNLIFETLMHRSRDEAFSLYGLLAESVEWDDDRTYIQFNLNPKAKWSDGMPVTPEDVIFSVNILNEKGRTPFSGYMNRIDKMEKVGEHSVRFDFNEKSDREFPLILASNMPILPKHATNIDTFDQTVLTPIIGSGPYTIKAVKAGEKITYQRNPDYWGVDIPAKVGTDNYDTINVEYYLQESTLFEAFKAGYVDIYPDGSATHWMRAYNFPAVENGTVIKDSFTARLPTGMIGFIFNTRRPVFEDIRVRKALSLVFDFEWINRTLYSNVYQRTRCFWQNSDLSGCAAPATSLELNHLGEAIKRLPPEILSNEYDLPVSDGTGLDRKILKQAVELLNEAGYTIRDGAMLDANGTQLAFEFMAQNTEQEKMALAYQRSLRAIGVNLTIRTVDDAQYQSRTGNFDYDMILKSYQSSLSPGVEQIMRWTSRAKDINGSLNFAGVADPDIDRMIDTILNAREPEQYRSAVRALDRLLMAGHYLVPLYHLGEARVARHSKIGRPDYLPLLGYQRPVWWDATVQKN